MERLIYHDFHFLRFLSTIIKTTQKITIIIITLNNAITALKRYAIIAIASRIMIVNIDINISFLVMMFFLFQNKLNYDRVRT